MVTIYIAAKWSLSWACCSSSKQKIGQREALQTLRMLQTLPTVRPQLEVKRAKALKEKKPKAATVKNRRNYL
jgi:hypothetical protein